jgi:hypothetical protein
MWPAASPPTKKELRGAFGVDVGELTPHPGGFEADAFTDGRWFVKVWRYEPDSDASLALTGALAARGVPAYGAEGLDLTHLEYALLARAVRDLAARVFNEVDRVGVETWGFARMRRPDADLGQARRFS